MNTRQVIYDKQIRRYTLRYQDLVFGDDRLAWVDTEIVPIRLGSGASAAFSLAYSTAFNSLHTVDLGMTAKAAIHNRDTVVVECEARGYGGEYEVQVRAETEHRRAGMQCVQLTALAQPDPPVRTLYLKREEQIPYRLHYDARFAADETLLTTTLGTIDPCLFAATQVEGATTALLVIGVTSDCTKDSYDFSLSATSDLGRTYKDTIRVIVGDCNG